jgi:hypothetical protein
VNDYPIAGQIDSLSAAVRLGMMSLDELRTQMGLLAARINDLTWAALDAGVVDCGEFRLRVVPSWGI